MKSGLCGSRSEPASMMPCSICKGPCDRRLLAAWLAASRLIGEAEPRERAARWLFSERVSTHGAHVIEQDMELASAMAGDALAPVQPWLPVDPAAEAWADEILPPATNPPAVLINPGAGWGAKRWPVERYAAVAQALIERGLPRAGQRRSRRGAAGRGHRQRNRPARPSRSPARWPS